MVADTVQVLSSGQMVPDMKANGSGTRPTDKENSGMLMVMSTKAIGKTIKLMVWEPMFMSTVPNTKDIGKMISRRATVSSHGVMEANTKVAIKKV